MLGWAGAVVLAGAFAALGTWQYGRSAEKQAQLDEAAEVLADRDAVPLAAAADPARARALEWSDGRGTFAGGGAFLLDNQRHDGAVGVRAYRVFVPDGGTPLLVDLGWLPMGEGRALPVVSRPEGPLDVRGLLAPPPSPGLALGTGIAAAGEDWLLTRIEPAVVADAAGVPAIAPRVLRLDPALPFGHARDLEVLANTLPPEKHVGYAVQWFGLAATVLAVAGVLTWRARKRGTTR